MQDTHTHTYTHVHMHTTHVHMHTTHVLYTHILAHMAILQVHCEVRFKKKKKKEKKRKDVALKIWKKEKEK